MQALDSTVQFYHYDGGSLRKIDLRVHICTLKNGATILCSLNKHFVSLDNARCRYIELKLFLYLLVLTHYNQWTMHGLYMV